MIFVLLFFVNKPIQDYLHKVLRGFGLISFMAIFLLLASFFSVFFAVMFYILIHNLYIPPMRHSLRVVFCMGQGYENVVLSIQQITENVEMVMLRRFLGISHKDKIHNRDKTTNGYRRITNNRN